MFSCGSLAPKLRRGGGCMDHGFKRDPEPWESTDGCVYLLRELAHVAPGKALPLLDSLAAAARKVDFRHALALQETIWTQFPEIFKVSSCIAASIQGSQCSAGIDVQALPKREAKRHLNQFLQPMINCATSLHRLSSHAAAYAVGMLCAMVRNSGLQWNSMGS